MAILPFVGPSYTLESVAYDCQRSLNVYPIKSESGTSKAVAALEGTPGTDSVVTLPKFPTRGSIEQNGRCFFIAGNGFYELFADMSYTEWGTLNTSTGNTSIATNGNQVCVVDNPNGYIFDLTTNTLTEITDPYYLGAVTVTYLDGYFVFNKPDSQVYFISALYDGMTGDPLDFASAEGSPDNLVAVETVHQQVWLFGGQTTQVVYNSGEAAFPLSVVQGSLMMYGCTAPYSVVTSANTVFWIGNDQDGAGVVFMSSGGYQPQRISTHAVELAIQSYANLQDASAYTYQENGHYFYCINFPSGNSTWVFDVELQLWHERAYFSNGEYSRQRQWNHVYAFGMHLVGDYETGDVYNQSLTIFTDNGAAIRRLRTFPHYAEDLQYLYFHQLQIDMQVGIGLDGTTTQPGYDPQIMLQWSNDGGNTWSNEYWVSAGKIGEYKTRAIWRRLGRARDRVFRVIFSAPCKTYWIAAHVQYEKGTA